MNQQLRLANLHHGLGGSAPRLLRGYQRLSQVQFIAMWNGLIESDPSGQILAA